MGSGQVNPGTGAFAITKSDTVALEKPTRGLYVGGSGNVKVTMADGTVATFTALAVGVIHPIAATLVWSTGTTATNIIGVY